MSNDYMYAIDRSDEYLSHYGVKGMKWGVRKAIASGNSRALARQYRKASRKLAKLESRAANTKTYKRRAIKAAAGAAALGGAAVAGTQGFATGVNALKTGGKALGTSIENLGASIGNYSKAHPNNKHLPTIAGAVAGSGSAVRRTAEKLGGVSQGIADWGAQSGNVTNAAKNAAKSANSAAHTLRGKLGAGNIDAYQRAVNRDAAISKWTNDTVVRGAAAAGAAGLAGVAGYNAYRAATAKKNAKKASEFRQEMNKAFAGTQYANGKNSKPKKRRNRR